MIRRIQALNYRCLHYVDVGLEGSFHILVGPNASGKSTLLDVIGFLGDLIRDGLDAAVDRRTRNFQDLVWDRPRKDPGFELAVEFDIPDALAYKLPEKEDYRSFPGLFSGFERTILQSLRNGWTTFGRRFAKSTVFAS